MKPRHALIGLLLLFAGLAIGYVLRSSSIADAGGPGTHPVGDSSLTLEESVRRLTQSAPGLGEFMVANQLHAAKLWFAAKNENWRLAKYELDELTEAMQAAEALHVTKNNVNITEVLTGVEKGMIPPLDAAIAGKDFDTFKHAYDQLLSACNGCHTASDHGFIKIVTPTTEPVSNQQWAP
ncbi:MAG: hypothetical protein JSS75_11240 [Bacteroidetes bacterium]|nr:hypothetical protein [Bacteroidota bacterium]